MQVCKPLERLNSDTSDYSTQYSDISTKIRTYRQGSNKSTTTNSSTDSGISVTDRLMKVRRLCSYDGSQNKNVHRVVSRSRSAERFTAGNGGHYACSESCLCAITTTRRYLRAGIQNRFMVQLSMLRKRWVVV